MTNSNQNDRVAGFTMIELMTAVAIFAGVLVSVGVLLESTSQATDYLTGSAELDHSLQKVMADLTTDLKCAPVSRTVIDTIDDNHDTILLQVPDPNAVRDPDFGYFDLNGVFQPGWYCFYFVNGDEFTKRRLDSTFVVMSDQVLCGFVDVEYKEKDDENKDFMVEYSEEEEKGFTVTAVDNLVTVKLRLHERAYSADQRRTVETTVLQVSQ